MKTSSMETFSTLLALCAGNSPVTGDFLSQMPVTRCFDIFFDMCMNKRFSKQSRRWWFETPSRSLWRHCNENDVDVASHASRVSMVVADEWIPNWRQGIYNLNDIWHCETGQQQPHYGPDLRIRHKTRYTAKTSPRRYTSTMSRVRVNSLRPSGVYLCVGNQGLHWFR